MASRAAEPGTLSCTAAAFWHPGSCPCLIHASSSRGHPKSHTTARLRTPFNLSPETLHPPTSAHLSYRRSGLLRAQPGAHPDEDPQQLSRRGLTTFPWGSRMATLRSDSLSRTTNREAGRSALAPGVGAAPRPEPAPSARGVAAAVAAPSSGWEPPRGSTHQSRASRLAPNTRPANRRARERRSIECVTPVSWRRRRRHHRRRRRRRPCRSSGSRCRWRST